MQSRKIALRLVYGIYFFPSSGSTGDISGGRETVTVFMSKISERAGSQEGAVRRLGVEREADVPWINKI